MKHVWLVMVCALVALAGCGGQGGDGADVPGAPDQIEIAVIPKGLVHQFWLTVRAGAEAAAEELEVAVIWQGPAKETEVAKQIDIVRDMLNRGVDAIVLAACDANALIPVVEEADRANVPVITIDSGVNSDVPKSLVATDNIAGARTAADKLAELIGKAGKVGLIPFVPGAATSEWREEGFKEGIKAYPDIELVATLYSQSDVAKGMDVTQDMLTSHPDLDGIFAASEPGAVGAAQAVKAAGKTGEVKLVGFDASEEEIAAVEDGTIQALIVQNPFKMGYLGVQSAVNALRGEPVDKRIDTGVAVITRENLDSPEIQALLNPQAAQ